MEGLLVLVVIAVFTALIIFVSGSGRPTSKDRRESKPSADDDLGRIRLKSGTFNNAQSTPVSPSRCLKGPAYVVDGDTVVISKVQIRLYGVDAPELNHPYGQKAKWALITLCKGQHVRADITAKDDYGRTVARCYLPDGRDLSAEMVKQGLALDWPKFSGGHYRHLERPDARKKLWLADARQKGRLHVWENFEAKRSAPTDRKAPPC